MIFTDKSGLKFEINKEERNAKIIKYSGENKNIFIPRFITYESEEYPIKVLREESFRDTSVNSITFPEDSELQTIENNALNSDLKKIYLPASVKELKKGWCRHLKYTSEILVSPENKYFQNYDKDILIGKSDPHKETFDTLYFVSRYVKQVVIPPFIKKINSFAFSNCNELFLVKFSEDSELEIIDDDSFTNSTINKIYIPKHVKTIGKNAFSNCQNLSIFEFAKDIELQTIGKGAFKNTKIIHLCIPKSVKKFHDGWCKKLVNIKDISVSPENKFFSVFEGKMIVEKTNPENEEYDVIQYVLDKCDELIIPPFIRKINECSISYCYHVRTVIFSENCNLEIIGKSAFSNSFIESIRIPKSVKIIEKNAFKECHALQKVVFDDDSQLEIIGESSFSKTPIKSIFIPKHVKTIDDGAFNECFELGEVLLSENSELKTIGKFSFSNTNIKKLTIPKNVEKIKETPFECVQLESISFEEPSKIRSIESNTFCGTNIKSLKLPSSIVSLSDGWCRSAPRLNEVTFTTTNDHFKILDNKIILGKSQPNNDQVFDVLIFAMRDVKEVKIPSYVKVIGSFAFSHCRMLESVTFEENSQLEKISEESFSKSTIKSIFIPKKVKTIGDCAFLECDNITSVTFADDSELQTIGKKAFCDSSLESIVIPKSVKEIESSAFHKCDNLESFQFSKESKIECISNKMLSETSIKQIKIPDRVKCIDGFAFHNCKKLKTVDISDESELTELKENVFNYLEKLYLPPHLDKLVNNSFSSVAEISISPNNKCYKVIDGQMIIGKSNTNSNVYDVIVCAVKLIQNVFIPSYIKKIGKYAFDYCEEIETVEFEANSQLEKIGKFAFHDSFIKKIAIPDHVKTIGRNAFCDSALSEIAFSDKSELEVIKDFAFANASVDIRIPKSVKTICDNAFKSVSNISFCDGSLLHNLGISSFEKSYVKLIVIPKHVQEIPEHCFEFSNVETVTFPEDSELKIIRNFAFSDSKLASINFPSKLEQLESNWASHLEYLVDINISAKNKHFSYLDDKIIVGKSNPNIDCYDTIVFALRDIENAVIPSHIKKIKPYAFEYCQELISVKLSENSELEIIDDFAFMFSSIEKIKVPKSLKYIGDNSFRSTSLETIEFPENSELISIGKKAFATTDITKFVFPNNDMVISSDLFDECENINEVVLPDCADSLDGIISDSMSIKTITIPPKIDDLTIIADLYYLEEIHISPNNKYYADIDGKIVVKKTNLYNNFHDIICFAVKKIEHAKIPSSIKVISESAFKSSDIDTIEFAEDSQLEIIENEAFRESKITSIKFPKHVKNIGHSCFFGCQKLHTVEFSEDLEIEKIREYTFRGSDIQTVLIPKSVKIIEKHAFDDCDNLRRVVFDDDSQLEFIGELSFANTLITNIFIPKHVKTIDDGAFNGCSQLVEVLFSESNELTTIGKNSFGRTNLRNITIPKNVEIMDEEAFAYCNLNEISFEEPSKVQTIGFGTFCSSSIESLKLPSSIVSLSEGWCRFTPKLNEVIFTTPNDRIKILNNKVILEKSSQFFESGAKEKSFDVLFFAPRNLKSIKIPSTIKIISQYAFSDCRKLESVTFEEDSQLEEICDESFSFSSISYIRFPRNLKKICYASFLNCKQLKQIEFDPESKVSIEIGAFLKSGLKGLIIPKFINKINEFPFENCSKLHSIEFLGDDIDIIISSSMVQYISLYSFPNSFNVKIKFMSQHQNNEIRLTIAPFGKVLLDDYKDYSDFSDVI